MGKLEQVSRKRTRISNLQKAVLGIVGLAGVLALAAVAPNVLGAIGKMGIIKKPRRDSVNRTRDRLIELGLLKATNNHLEITEKGRYELSKAESFEYRLKKPRRWDGKWRILIFDIREERRGVRNKLRRTLISVGFKRLQDSVWVYPYDCEDFIALLKFDFHIGRDMLYLIVDKMEGEFFLKKHFNV